ncbi:MAG: RNA polymerase sigma factor [Gemmatimonadota bacterium]
MDPSRHHSEELEARLAELHSASFGWACSCCGWNEADAEDVLQTTYLKVISGRARYDGRSAFRTWLFGVIRHTAREFLRSKRSHREKSMILFAQQPDDVEHPEPTASLEAGELAAEVKASLSTLPDRQREVLELVFYQEMTIREAADVMEVSIGSARVHYDRGKKKLRALLSSESKSEGTT